MRVFLTYFGISIDFRFHAVVSGKVATAGQKRFLGLIV